MQRRSHAGRAGTWALAAAFVVTTTSGCSTSGSSTEREVEQVANRFAGAIREDQGRTACRLLTPAAASSVQQDAGKPCNQAITELQLPVQGSARHSTVYIHAAKVDLRRSVLFLSPFGGRWRIYAAGCTGESYPPYDCTVQG